MGGGGEYKCICEHDLGKKWKGFGKGGGGYMCACEQEVGNGWKGVGGGGVHVYM